MPEQINPNEPVAHKAGQPGRRRKTILPNQIPWIRKWASQGYSKVAIAHKLNVNQATFLAILEREPRVRQAWEEGAAEEEVSLVDTLKAQAARGHIGGAIFLLKARHGYRENDPSSVVNVNNDNRVQVVQLPAAQSQEDFARLMRQFQGPGNALPGTVLEGDATPVDRSPANPVPFKFLVERK